MSLPARRFWPWCLPLAVLAPGLAWLALDQAVWPWDQAWFGAQTVTLYERLRHAPFEWPGAVIHATPLKPPLVAWIGQFFVPLGIALGSVDAALLLSVWLTHAVALVLVFRALRELAGGRVLVAAAGTLAAGAAPLFVSLSTQYLAEGSQTLAVGWFVFIMASAPRWGRARIAAHVVAATAFAMLAKTTSPLFCAGPALVTLAELVRRKPRAPAPRLLWGAAILLAGLAGAWYLVNREMVLLHVRTAAFSSVSENYGERASFLAGFSSWWGLAHRVFFLWPLAPILAALAVLGGARRLRRGADGATGRLDIAAAACFGQILLTLAAFSLSAVRETRYLEALLPLVAVVVAWVVAQAGRAAASAVIALLGIQLALVQSQVLGLWPARLPFLRAGIAINPALHHRQDDAGPADRLAAIVRRTCDPGASGAFNFVGVDLVHLSGHSLTYAAAKERLAGRAGVCRYDSVAFAPVESAEHEVQARPYVYWIAVDPEVLPIPAHHAFLNQSAPVVFARLQGSGALQPEPWADGPPGIRLFRFVRP